MSRYKLQNESNYVIDQETGESLINTHERYVAWLAVPGNIPDPADPPPPPPIVYKEKNSIQLQLMTAGKMAQARAILNSPGMEDPKSLWEGSYKVAYNDADVRNLIKAVGMDDEDVMSKATNWGG